MNARKMEFAAVLLLGGLLGFAVANYRYLVPGETALAQEKKGQPGGIFSPPGTTDTGPVTPPPGEPPFNGKIGRTIGRIDPRLAAASRRSQGRAECAVHRARRRRVRSPWLLRLTRLQDAAPGQACRGRPALQ